jgi:hypothetical protein
VTQAAIQLVGAHRYKDVKKTSLYALKSLLQTAVTKASSLYKSEGVPFPPCVVELSGLLDEATEMHANFE